MRKEQSRVFVFHFNGKKNARSVSTGCCTQEYLSVDDGDAWAG
jgi:hypothetical protein